MSFGGHVILIGLHPLLIAVLLSVASGNPDPPPAEPLAAVERIVAHAEDALRHGEGALAESRYRDALLEAWLVMGDLEMAEGQLKEAREALQNASAASIDARRPHRALATLLLQMGEPMEAVKILTGDVARNRHDSVARRLLAQALVTADQPEQALQELEEAHEAMPDDLEISFALASGYVRAEKNDAAARLFAVIEKARPIPQTYVLIGRTYRDYRQFDRAQAVLKKALELDPHVRRAHYYLGTSAGMSMPPRFEEAMAEFEKELLVSPDDELSHRYLGMSYAELRRYAEALPHLERACAARPDPECVRYLGRAQLALDRGKEAVVTLRQALEMAERDKADDQLVTSIHYQLALALRRTGAEAEAAPHFAAAERSAAKGTDTARERLQNYMTGAVNRESKDNLGTQLQVSSPYSAIAAAQRAAIATQIKSTLCRAYVNMGILHAQAQRFARAAEEIEHAAALDPEFPQVQYSLGVAYFNAGQFEKAEPPLARVLASTPSDRSVRRMLAAALFNTDAYDRTIDLLKDDPGRESDPSLQYLYAVALVRGGRAAEAEATFSRLLQIHGKQPDLLVVKGQAQEEQGDYDGATASLQAALAQNPDVLEANATLGVIYLKQGRLPEAEKALRAEIQPHPDNMRARHHLAVVLDRLDRPQEAAEQLRKVLAARPSFGEARYLMGKVLLALGAPEEAAVHLEAAVRLTPEKAAAHFQLAKAYQKLGRAEQAEQELGTYRHLKEKGREEKP
jgi:tetratricopeptide (TPR) repeat protein